jgi:subtilisin family serine protease
MLANHGRCFTVALVAAAFLLSAGLMTAQAKMFPNIDYVDWNYDADQNRIDDRLETMKAFGEGDSIQAVVLFNHCLTPMDTMFVGAYATIDYIGQYVQGIWVSDVDATTLISMIGTAYGDTAIFRLELSDSVYAYLDVSCRAVKARQSATYSPNTAWDQGFNGTGVNIAILDTGVDDGHPALAGKFVAGFNAITGTPGNPDDDYSPIFHGTHVAGTALGSDPNTTYMGVAPGAGLIDVKVLNSAGSGTWAQVIAGIDWCIANRAIHNIKVLNLSLGGGGSCNGKCAACMAVDRAVDAGLTVCVAAGNSGWTGAMPSPAAADRAITVGAVADQGTVVRNDDAHAAFSNAGPRLSDGDNDTVDEQKPDVVAPGVTINAPEGINPGQNPPNQYQNLQGTSMACPHVAGVCAILLSAKPGMSPDDVKVTLRKTSRDAAQNINPAYSATWGKGEVDAFQATASALAADLFINSWVRDIYTPVNPPRVGVLTNLNARVRNNGPNNANGVDVLFFTNRNNMGYGGWSQIGQATVNVPSGGMTVATVPWTPLQGHQCIRARAVYSGDANLGNNEGQDNFDPAPSKFYMEAGTPFAEPKMFTLEIGSWDLLVADGWWAKIWTDDDLFDTLFIDTQGDTAVGFMIEDDRCPRMIRVEINHPDSAPVNEYSRIVFRGLVDTLVVGQQTLMSYVPEPTPVELSSLSTRILRRPGLPAVEIMWATASEIDNAGFHIYRSLSEGGTAAKINREIIPSRGDQLRGGDYSFVDTEVASGLTYYYWLEEVGLRGDTTRHGPVFATPVSLPGIPHEFSLAQNSPNPFRVTTEISYALPADCKVDLKIYDCEGRFVRTVVAGQQAAGYRTTSWDGKNQAGNAVAGGVYFYRLSAGERVEMRKMVYLR